MDYFPVLEGLTQFPWVEKKIRIPRFGKSGLFNSEGLIYQQTAFFQSLFYALQQGAMQIAKDQNCTVGIAGQGVDPFLFQIYLPDPDTGLICLGKPLSLAEILLRYIAAHDLKPLLRQKYTVSTIATGEVQHRTW